MVKYLLILLFWTEFAAAQSFYTPVRAAFGIEAMGISPRSSVNAEAMFGYRRKSFLDVQGGIGWVNSAAFRSPAGSFALTFCQLINPYRRSSCDPRPGSRLIEAYLEAGAAAFLLDRYDNTLFTGSKSQRFFTPMGLAGFRVHVVSAKWIYILKLRVTPALVESKFASIAGIGLGLGWR